MAMTSVSLHSFSLSPPRNNNHKIHLSFCPSNPNSLPVTSVAVHIKLHNRLYCLAESEGGTPVDQVQELRVPQAWSSPSIALQESEWLRETLHKWLDEEYCPEPTNIEISKVASQSYYESLISKETDLGEILLKMAGDLERISYRESFHGAFSSANAAVRLITHKMESLTDQ
ncbi:hypothetical protein LUZ60_015567 [Juncus effusus]|nr:hypothetical protein LUZ60_015567 [Juncus effusus]